MHSPSPQMANESNSLCQPSGASSRSGSLRIALQPFVQFYRHGCEELSLVNSAPQMLPVGAALGVSRRPDSNRRHELTDGVYNLLGKTLGLFRTWLGFFETGVELL